MNEWSQCMLPCSLITAGGVPIQGTTRRTTATGTPDNPVITGRLDPSIGGQDHTPLPSAPMCFVFRASIRPQSRRTLASNNRSARTRVSGSLPIDER